MNNNTLSIAALALGLTFASISVSRAQGDIQNNNAGMTYGGMAHGGMMHGSMAHGVIMHGGMMHGGMMYSQLNLTREQQKQIQSIMSAAMSTTQGWQNMMKNMQAHMAESQALINNPSFDESKAREMISRHQELMMDNQLNMLKARHQVFQILTEQQKEQFNALMAQHSAMMQQHMSNMEQ